MHIGANEHENAKQREFNLARERSFNSITILKQNIKSDRIYLSKLNEHTNQPIAQVLI